MPSLHLTTSTNAPSGPSDILRNLKVTYPETKKKTTYIKEPIACNPFVQHTMRQWHRKIQIHSAVCLVPETVLWRKSHLQDPPTGCGKRQNKAWSQTLKFSTLCHMKQRGKYVGSYHLGTRDQVQRSICSLYDDIIYVTCLYYVV